MPQSGNNRGQLRINLSFSDRKPGHMKLYKELEEKNNRTDYIIEKIEALESAMPVISAGALHDLLLQAVGQFSGDVAKQLQPYIQSAVAAAVAEAMAGMQLAGNVSANQMPTPPPQQYQQYGYPPPNGAPTPQIYHQPYPAQYPPYQQPQVPPPNAGYPQGHQQDPYAGKLQTLEEPSVSEPVPQSSFEPEMGQVKPPAKGKMSKVNMELLKQGRDALSGL